MMCDVPDGAEELEYTHLSYTDSWNEWLWAWKEAAAMFVERKQPRFMVLGCSLSSGSSIIGLSFSPALGGSREV